MSPGFIHRDAIRMELLRWLDRSPGYAALPQTERRALAGAGGQLIEFLCEDIAWLYAADDDEEPEVAPLRDVLAHRLGLDAALDGATEPGDPVGFAGFVTELVKLTFEGVVDADTATLRAYADLLTRLGQVAEGAPPGNTAIQRRIAAALARHVGVRAD